MDEQQIEHKFKELNDRHNKLYEFVILYNNYIFASHDYGTEDALTMIEAHTVTFIDDHPGTTISAIADFWARSRGAISQTVSRLEKWGFVYKQPSEKDRKVLNLYVTDKGKAFSIEHKLYDTQEIAKTQEQLLESVSKEEIDAFFKVLEAYVPLVRNDFQ